MYSIWLHYLLLWQQLGYWSLERTGQETSGLENTRYSWSQEYCMNNRGWSQQVYTKFDMLLLLALFHSDPIAMIARLVPSRQVIGKSFFVDVDIKCSPREYVSHVTTLPCHPHSTRPTYFQSAFKYFILKYELKRDTFSGTPLTWKDWSWTEQNIHANRKRSMWGRNWIHKEKKTSEHSINVLKEKREYCIHEMRRGC